MEMKVEDLLIDLKNTTELMVDLAYSALLYENREIAGEVVELEEEIDRGHVELLRMARQSIEKGTSAEAVLAVARLAISLEMIADAAREIAEVILQGIELHPVVRLSLAESDVVITRVEVAPSSGLVGKTLGELRLSTRTGMWVIAIRRGKRWIYGPDEDDMILEGDILYARGPGGAAEEFREIAAGRITLP